MEAMGEITQEESNLESLTELGFSEEEVETLVSNALKVKMMLQNWLWTSFKRSLRSQKRRPLIL